MRIDRLPMTEIEISQFVRGKKRNSGRWRRHCSVVCLGNLQKSIESVEQELYQFHSFNRKELEKNKPITAEERKKRRIICWLRFDNSTEQTFQILVAIVIILFFFYFLRIRHRTKDSNFFFHKEVNSYYSYNINISQCDVTCV